MDLRGGIGSPTAIKRAAVATRPQERGTEMRKLKGFSLIELLIVVAIILIIAAIAIPNLLRSRIAANEASAVGSMRTINTSELTYANSYPQFGFTNLGSLGGPVGCAPLPTNACILDPYTSQAPNVKSGFTLL